MRSFALVRLSKVLHLIMIMYVKKYQKVLQLFHYIQVEIGRDFKKLQDLVEHLSVLTGNADLCLEVFCIRFERLDERSHFYGFGARPENEHHLFHRLFIEPAEIEDNFAFRFGKGFERVVCDEECHDVRLFEGGFVVRKFVDGVVGHVRFDDEDFGVAAGFEHFGDDVFGGRFSQVVDIGFECQAHHRDNRFAVVFKLEFEDFVFDALGAPEGFVVVYFPRLGNCDSIGKSAVRKYGSTAMQCPPTPQPGCRIFTRGCLFARLISSQTFIPALSQMSDNSFAKAIWTSREEFSVSLHISAVFAFVRCSLPFTNCE